MRIAGKPFTLPIDLTRQIKFISPNIFELIEIAKALNYPTAIPDRSESIAAHPAALKTIAEHVNGIVDNILITLGSHGALIVRKHNARAPLFNQTYSYLTANESDESQLRFYPAKAVDNVVNVSGAGDSFNSGFITAMIRGKSEGICVAVGFQSAITALRSTAAVPRKYFDADHLCWTNPAECKPF